MSTGPFSRTKYLDDDGLIHPIRVQPEGAAINGTAPTGDVDSSISAQVGGSRRQYGLHARGVRLYREIGSGDTAAKRYNFYPVLTPTAFASISEEQEFTINTIAWKVLSKVEEKRR